MTFKELREEARPAFETLARLQNFAANDEFAPWVVSTLAKAAFYASLSDEAIDECRAEDES